MEDIVCLKCGGELDVDEYLDMDFDGSEVHAFVIGHCLECGADHKWIEDYKFSSYSNLTIDND